MIVLRFDFEELGISDDFAAASNHPYHCRCSICRQWWLDMGPEGVEDGFGVFGDELWPEYAEKRGLTVEEAKALFAEQEP